MTLMRFDPLREWDRLTERPPRHPRDADDADGSVPPQGRVPRRIGPAVGEPRRDLSAM